jgi:hypothetical protein
MLAVVVGAARELGAEPRRLRTPRSIHSGCKRLDLGGIEPVRAVLIESWKEVDPFEPADSGDALPDPLCDLRSSTFSYGEREFAKLDRQRCDDLDLATACARARTSPLENSRSPISS